MENIIAKSEMVLSAIVFIIVFVFTLLLCGDAFGIIFAWIGNPILRKLGLQSEDSSSNQFSGRIAKVITSKEVQLRVELEGTTWNAVSVDPNWIPQVNESVQVEGIQGLTLQISQIKNIAN